MVKAAGENVALAEALIQHISTGGLPVDRLAFRASIVFRAGRLENTEILPVTPLLLSVRECA